MLSTTKSVRFRRGFTLFCWVGAIAWMILIFTFSAQDASHSSHTSRGFLRMILNTLWLPFRRADAEAQAEILASLQFLVRKTAHFCLYGMLGLWFLGSLWPMRLPPWSRPFASAGLALLYAITDEIHQSFVPGRSCKAGDVALDTAGALTFALLAMGIWALWIHHRNNMSNKKSG